MEDIVTEFLSGERVFPAFIALSGVLIGIFSASALQRRSERLAKKSLALSLAVEIDTVIEQLKSDGNLRDTIESANDRFKDGYTGPFPRYFDSRVSAKELNESWLPIFRSNASKIGWLGAKNASNLTRFHLLMGTIFSDFIRYSHEDFWGRDHEPSSKQHISEKHLNMIDEAIKIGLLTSKSLHRLGSGWF